MITSFWIDKGPLLARKNIQYPKNIYEILRLLKFEVSQRVLDLVKSMLPRKTLQKITVFGALHQWEPVAQ